MSANDRQIGGGHYKTGYEHWDWCIDLNIGYLEAAASKYVSRWQNKNGIQDLEKAIHYLEKAQEGFHQYSAFPWSTRRYRNRSFYVHEENKAKCALKTSQFCESAKLGVLETEIMYICMSWQDSNSLNNAIILINELIRKAQEAHGQAGVTATAAAPSSPPRTSPGRWAWGNVPLPPACTSSERLKKAFEQLMAKLRG